MSDPIDLAQFEGHTPGKWRVGELFGGGRIRIFEYDTLDTIAAVIPSHGWTDGITAFHARLIAAAPSLLAELRALRAADESRKRRDAAVDELVAAASELCEIAAISIAFGVMREDHDGPLPRTLHALAAIKGEAK